MAKHWNKMSSISLSPCQLSIGTKNHRSTFLIIPLWIASCRSMEVQARAVHCVSRHSHTGWNEASSLVSLCRGVRQSASSSVDANMRRHFTYIPSPSSCDCHKTLQLNWPLRSQSGRGGSVCGASAPSVGKIDELSNVCVVKHDYILRHQLFIPVSFDPI